MNLYIPRVFYIFFAFELSFDALKPQFGYNCVPAAVSLFDERLSSIHVPTHGPPEKIAKSPCHP